MKTLKPVYDKLSYSSETAEVLARNWFQELFKPLLDILKEKLNVRQNSKAALKRALESGKVQWYDNFFTGPFSAAVSKDIRSLGGTWNKSKKAFACELRKLPNDIKAAIGSGHSRVTRTVEDIYRKLDEIQDTPSKKQDFTPQFQKVLKDLNKQFVTTAKVDLGVHQEIPPDFAHSYSDSLNAYSEDFTRAEAFKIRTLVGKNVQEGFRSDRLMKTLQAQYGVTKRKAKFLARQETSLLVSKFRQKRYTDIGLNKYKWSTSHDERVRKDHKELNGRIFDYANPPITDKATGAKNNPGEDFNCRCVAIPVLEEEYANVFY